MEDLIKRQFEWYTPFVLSFLLHFFLLLRTPLVMHCANTYCLVGDLLLHTRHSDFLLFGFPLIYFCCYAVFSWYWFNKTNVFYYFFLDPLFKYSIVAYLGLLVFAAGNNFCSASSLCFFFSFSSGISIATITLRNHGPIWMIRIVFCFVAWFVCRFRDSFERKTKRKK